MVVLQQELEEIRRYIAFLESPIVIFMLLIIPALGGNKMPWSRLKRSPRSLVPKGEGSFEGPFEGQVKGHFHCCRKTKDATR
ncbi:hypothetical protein AXF42_Ash020464 [Apostasia shenzhenica]|uniref:Uncharacterized protein n=1 Tax=Apostasia shenzhenica TaxID=1088818 RepID=A0A2H9ZYM1_9ASPA|nr:hypothetical protein AXF42_Ash020464 [Apostasia shenzhenica]